MTTDIGLPFPQPFSPNKSALLWTGKAAEPLTEKRESGSKTPPFLESKRSRGSGSCSGDSRVQTLAPSAWTCDARDLARVIEDSLRPAATVLGVGEGGQHSPGLRVLCVRPPVPVAPRGTPASSL